MKVCVKKVYCPHCQKLVRCHEQRVDGRDQVLCSKCGHALWLWARVGWRYLRETV